MRRSRGARRVAPFAAPRLCALFAALALGFSACTSAPPYEQRVHVVHAGDTLFSIAWAYGVDQRDLARWNGIKNPDVIQVGQRLRLSPPTAEAQAKSGKSAQAPASHGSPAAALDARRHAAGRWLPGVQAEQREVARGASATELAAAAVGLARRRPGRHPFRLARGHRDRRRHRRPRGRPGARGCRGPRGLRGQRSRRLRAARDHQAQRDLSDRIRLQQRAARHAGAGRRARAEDRVDGPRPRAAATRCTSRSGATACRSIRCSSSRDADAPRRASTPRRLSDVAQDLLDIGCQHQPGETTWEVSFRRS